LLVVLVRRTSDPTHRFELDPCRRFRRDSRRFRPAETKLRLAAVVHASPMPLSRRAVASVLVVVVVETARAGCRSRRCIFNRKAAAVAAGVRIHCFGGRWFSTSSSKPLAPCAVLDDIIAVFGRTTRDDPPGGFCGVRVVAVSPGIADSKRFRLTRRRGAKKRIHCF